MERVLEALGAVYQKALANLKTKVVVNGRLNGDRLNDEQLAAHALAYLATELEACRQLSAWAARVGGEFEGKVARAYVGELARNLRGGVDLGACENIALADLGLTDADLADTLLHPEVQAFSAAHSTGAIYLEIAQHARDKGFGNVGLDDEMLEEVRAQFAKFSDQKVIPIAQDVHRQDKLIPMDILEQMAELGVFGLTIPEEYGGLGLSKVAMCVVTEELSRGYIGVGSLGTRSEIAAELIMGGGTEAQKREWLPKLASGEVLSTAVFTEPNNGSDLANLTTRAVKQADGSYVVSGAKTWITHAVRADVMTLLARTNPDAPGYQGLSMFLARRRAWAARRATPSSWTRGSRAPRSRCWATAA
jgi:(2S)-methylsuccinyl-CoA dehydrogenase